jgi:SH3-like domain-containing protein
MYKIIYTLIYLTIFISSSIAEETFVSLKKNKVNVRYGPSFESDIKFVYKKISGWIHISQLKRNNSVIALQNKVLFKKPSSFAKPIAQIEKGRLLIVDKCQEKWCKIKSEDYEGWIKTNDIWGLIN